VLGTTIDVYVKDNNGCVAPKKTITIASETPPQINTPAAQCYTGSLVSVKITGTVLGTPTYSIDDVTYGGNDTFLLGVGTHTLYIKDGFGCKAQTTYKVAEQLTLGTDIVPDTSCTPNTTIKLTANGGTVPYVKYEVSTSGAGGPFTTITDTYTATAAGTYTFRVTDSATPACTAVSAPVTVTLKATALTINATPTDVKCNGSATGVITITALSGKAPFKYNVTKAGVSVSTSAITTGLQAGLYNVVVTDDLGCTSASTPVTINQLDPLTATTALTTALTCGTANAPQKAVITVSAPSGGSGGYEYSYNNGSYTTDTTFETTLSGTVTIRMRDSNNCTQDLADVVVNTLNPPVITSVTPSIITCKTGEDTSTATIVATGGTGTKVYSIVSGPVKNATGASNGIFTGLTAGTYLFKVTDDNFCSDTFDLTIPGRVNINASWLSQVNVLCYGNPTGSAKITVTNSTSYTAALTSGTGTVLATGSTVDVTGLVAGAYNLRVTDTGTECFKDVPFTITQSADLALLSNTDVNANCNKPTATVTVTATGGKAPYKYAFVANGVTPTAANYLDTNVGNLDPATPDWDVYVLDANNCSKKIYDVTVAKDALPSISAPAAQCFTGPFTITLSGSGGVGTLKYTVNGASISGNTYKINAPGTYILGVIDGNNCPPVTVSYVVDKQLIAGAELRKDITCTAPQDAIIDVTITNGVGPFSYQIYNGGTAFGALKTSSTATFTETFATQGSYTFEIKDSKTCTFTTAPVEVTPTQTLVLNKTLLAKPILCNGQSDAEITVTYNNSQGTGPFDINVKQYADATHLSLTKDFGTQTSGLPAGFYVVTLTDSRGCFKTDEIEIKEPTPISVTYIPTNITCNLGNSGKTKGRIEITQISGGTGPYNVYVTNNSAYYEERLGVDGLSSETFDIIDFGLYQIVVTDANGCPWIEKDILIAQPPGGLGLTVSATPPVCGSLGSAEVKITTAFTGTGPFYFALYTPGIEYAVGDPRWIPEVTPNVSKNAFFNNLIPGVTYTFIVYDKGTNCYYYETFKNTIPSNSTLTATGKAVPIKCKDDDNGSVDLHIENIYSTDVDVSYEIFDSATRVSTGISDNGTVPAKVGSVNGVLDVDDFGFTPGLKYGTYYVLITETSGPNAGCAVTTVPFSITESINELKIIATKTKNDNTCKVAGTITASGIDGTSPYTYAIVDDGDPEPTAFAGVNTFTVDSGDYDVYVKDAYGCIKKADVNVPLDVAPVIDVPAAVCYTGTPIALTITGNTAAIVGPVTYSVDKGAAIGAYKSAANFSLLPGTYTLNLKDGNGCVSSTTYVINDVLTIKNPLNKPLDCYTTGANAEVTVAADGGSGTYAYTIKAGPTTNVTGATSGIFTGLASGDYTFEVNDGNCTETIDVKIAPLNTITPAVAETQPLCIGNNGKVVVSATGGKGNFEYKKGAAGTYSTNDTFTQSAADGTVTYYVRDANHCEVSITATLTDPSPVIITKVDISQLTCGASNSTNEATITVTASGGTGALEYSFDNGGHFSGNNIFKTSIAGPYDIIVRDANKCTSVMQTETIDVLVPPTMVPTKTVIDCQLGNEKSTVNLHRGNGVGPFTYSVVYASNGAVIPSQVDNDIFTSLDAGEYLFRVTDNNGCTDEELVRIPALIPIELHDAIATDVKCVGAATGKAVFTVTGVSAAGYNVTNVSPSVPYTIAGDVITLPNLTARTYTVTIEDNTTKCQSSKSVTINEPLVALAITATASNVSCYKPISTITVTPVGGAGNYEFAFQEGGTVTLPTVFSSNTKVDTALLTNAVTVGAVTTWSVDVYVKDGNNCTEVVNVTITKDVAPTIIAPAPQCYEGTNLIVDLNALTTVHGGPKSYTLNGSDLTTSTATLTGPGKYRLGVRDNNGCEAFVDYIIEKQLRATADLKKDLYCTGTTDASIYVEIKDGVAPYKYQMYLGAAPVGGLTTVPTVPGNSFTVSVATAGDYTFVITDSNAASCSVTTTKVTVNTPTPAVIVSTPVTQSILCNGGTATMKINLSATAGLEPFTYTVTRTLPTPLASKIQTSDNVFTNLPAGTYEITVTDKKGCVSLVTTTDINEPALLTAAADPLPRNTTCSTSTVITVVANGGTKTGSGTGYYYNFNNEGYTTDNTYTVENDGTVQTITYTVKDANGCETGGQTVDVYPLNKPNKLDFSASTITCKAGEDVSTVTVRARNGVGQLTFTIVGTNTTTSNTLFGPKTTPDSSVAASFPGLLPGDYTFQVEDSNGCTFVDLFTVPKLVNLALDAQLVNDISCNPVNGISNNGKATFTVSNVSTSGFTVVGVTPAVPYSVAGNVITLDNISSAGTYTVSIKDLGTDCPKDATVKFTVPAAITFNTVSTKVFCSRDESNITISGVLGGTGIYSYAVVKATTTAPSASSYLDSPTLKVDTNLTDLSWDVYVKDTNGCIAVKTVSVTHDAPPSILPPAPQCYTGTNLVVDLNALTTVYGGAKSYTLNGSDLTTSTATLTGPGKYRLGVRDNNGCEAFVDYIIEKQLRATADLKKDLYCTGTTDASIYVEIKDGVAPYKYQMYLGPTPVGGLTTVPTVPGNSFTVSVATAGDYTFVITDSNPASCSVTTTKVTVNTPTPAVIVSTPVTQSILCNGGTATMKINLSATAGLEPFTYTVTRTLPTPLASKIQTSDNVFTNLPAGTYEITVTDKKGCVSLVTTTDINEPALLTAAADPLPRNTTCSTSTVITVVANGGTKTGSGTGYYYNFNNEGYTTDNTYTVENDGTVQTITYTVKDANGCETGGQTVDVNPLNKPNKLDFSASTITCKAGEDVSSTVTVRATNGVGQLTFTIVGTNTTTSNTLFGPITTPGSASAASFPGLLPGDYTFKVEDSNGCTFVDLFTVPKRINILADGQLVAGVACKGEANGKVTFTVSSIGTSGFTHTISGVTGVGTITPVGTNKFELTNLVTGTYKIDVKDNATDCVSTFSVFVPEPNALRVNYATNKNANCNKGAEITATALDGTPGYTYAFVKAGDPKVYGNSDTAVLDKAFTWVIWAKDSHGCETSIPVTIITDPLPNIVSAIATQCPSSNGTYDITVTATGFDPAKALEYSVDGNSFQNSNVLKVNNTGQHTVTVRDANLCPVSTTVTILEPLKLDYELTTTPICLGNQGVVTLKPSGGTVTPSYEFSKDGVNYGPSPIFTGLVPNTYTFTVKDKGTGCTKSVRVVIETPNQAIDFTLEKTNITCNGYSDGTVTVKMADQTLTVNNNPVYTYSISPAAGTLTGNVFKNLPVGTYTITVTSGKGCPVSRLVAIGDKLPIVVANPTVAEYGCTTGNGTNDATITVSLPSGGSNSYKIYEFIRNGNPVPVQSNDSPVYTETDLLGGSYVINVYDTNGCVGTTTATIKPFVGIEFGMPSAITVTKAITCINDEDIKVNVVMVGTTVPMPVLEYNLKGITAGSTYDVTNNDGIFTGLTIGNYAVTVTNPITGCVLSKIHYVNNPNTFSIVAENLKNVSCFGTPTGSVDLTFVDNQTDPTNDAGPFDYTISGPVNLAGRTTTATINIPNLPEGTYTVKAKLVGLPACEVETSFAIEQPSAALVLTEIHTPISCNPGNDGTISLSAVGGWPGSYKFELSGPISVTYSDQTYFENLTPGTYTVRVKDLNGCVDVKTVQLKNPDPILVTASATVSTLVCNGDTTGQITVDLPTGGQGTNYSYILNYLSTNPVISSAPQPSPVFSNLGAGTYSVTVVDGLNCASQPTADIVIDEPSKVEPLLALNTRLTCKNAATLKLSAVGGTGPYEYSTDANFATVLGSFASSTIITVGLGDHQYYVRDSKGCISTISNNISINPLTPLALETIDVDMVYCKDDPSGRIDASAIGGLGDYIYTLLDDQKNEVRPGQLSGYFELLPAGKYIVRVDSGDCQFDSAVIEITQPTAPLIATANPVAITCNGFNNGKIEITASGGTGKILYAISPNMDQFFEGNTAGGHVFTNLKPGEYDILVMDENSCNVQEKKILITEPDEILVTEIVADQIPEYCFDDKNGMAVVKAEGGTAPYTASIKGNGVTLDYRGPDIDGDKFIFDGLSGAVDYEVMVKDANGCENGATIRLPDPVKLTATAEVFYDCLDDHPVNSLVVEVDNTIDATRKATIVYTLFKDGQATTTVQTGDGTFKNLVTGDYSVQMALEGCTRSTNEVHVDAVEELTAVPVVSKEMNIIEVKASGGVRPYTYSFNNEAFGSSSTYRIYKDGRYDVIVRDNNGCEFKLQVPGDFVDICFANFFTPNGDGDHDTIGPDCGALAYKDLTFDIFDRYGRVVAKYHVGEKWDGKYNGAELPTGDYWYVLKLNDEKDAREFVGHFTLYR
ncbi:T9SS type B sorting domain-containing protein, partial [Flavobacterium cutihirudinis]|uniref:T9SS type B sorting domain-containing protein n=1 Tax=Flavobacterium cutihirudinis TaxID=1265740 RepID=UPI00142D8928